LGALRLGLQFSDSARWRWSLARAKTRESTDFNLVAGSQGPDDAVKYGANDNVSFFPGQLGSVANLLSQISSGHLEHPGCITKESITAFLGAPCWQANTLEGCHGGGRRSNCSTRSSASVWDRQSTNAKGGQSGDGGLPPRTTSGSGDSELHSITQGSDVPRSGVSS
jgi:hypothetical protein